MRAQLTTKIPLKDGRGNVTREKEVATFAGLLAKAHEEGLKRIETELLQVPSEDNHFVAIARAVVETDKGVFTGIGDASAENVNRMILPHIIRMAETRAKARALRDAVNIGLVALEELGGDGDILHLNNEPPPSNVRPLRANRPTVAQHEAPRSDRMTVNQRRLLFRLMAAAGLEGDSAIETLCQAADTQSLEDITKRQASRIIDAWKQEVGRD